MQIPLNRFLTGALAAASLLTPAFVPASCAQTVPGSVAAPSEKPYDVYGRGPYRAYVPRPSSLLGYELGAKHTTFREQEQVIRAIADAAKNRVRVVEYGTSTEGRPLRLIFISSPENIARLDSLRDQNARLADPRKLSGVGESEQIVKSAPVFTWINECIHGDETASFETGMWSLYTLAASDNPVITDTLAKSVVILNPVYNPDGHERYVVWYNSVAQGLADGGAYEKTIPWALRGRFNHYRFDMNRDKIAQSQNETRAETAALLQWNPQVYVDQHGQPPVYFFPPNALASNRHAGRARVNQWTDTFGRANGQVFDSYGWAYVNRETYDFFYPGYLDLFSTLTGAVGMTYETDGGGVLARKRDDGTVSTLRDASIHHLESALTTITTAAANRESLLRDYLAFHQAALGATGEKMRRVVVLGGRDPERLARLADHLRRVGIEARQTSAPLVSVSSHSYLSPTEAPAKRTFPAGALIVDLAQAQGHLARALLDPATDMEPEFVREQLRRRETNAALGSEEEREGYQFYDTTAWALPLAYELESYWTEDAGPVAAAPAATTASGGGVTRGAAAPVLYLWSPDRDNAPVLALRLLSEGFRLSTATRPISAGGRTWPRGTVIARVSRNADTLGARLDTLARGLSVTVTGLSSAYTGDEQVGVGSDVVAPLRRPRIAVATDEGVSQTGYGAVWHLLDTEQVPFTAVRLRALPTADLSRYNVLILPDGGYASTLGKTGIDALKQWVRGGGVLLGLAGGGTWFTDRDAGLTTATPVGQTEPDADKKAKPKEKPTDLPGALFRARIKPENFLGWGYPEGEIAVPLQGSTFLNPSRTGTNVVTFGASDKQPLTLSGFVWPGNTEKLLAEPRMSWMSRWDRDTRFCFWMTRRSARCGPVSTECSCPVFCTDRWGAANPATSKRQKRCGGEVARWW